MQRPTSILVFGILHIVFGVFGFCGVVGNMALFVVENDGTNPVITAMHESPAYRGYIIASIPLGLIGTVALLAAGIGLLNNMRWSRPLSNVYAWYTIIVMIVGIVINAFVLLVPAFESQSGQMTPEDAGMIGGAIGGTCGGFIGMIYPVLILIFLNRRIVKDWFDPSRPRQAADTPIGPTLEPWDR